MLSNTANLHRQHFIITSLLADDFFYDYEICKNDSSYLKHLANVEQWHHSAALFKSDEQKTPLELFRRRLNARNYYCDQSLIYIATIVPSNFNKIYNNVELDAVYEDKILVFTPKHAKLYYIISKLEKDMVLDLKRDSQSLLIVFINENSITKEFYEIKNGELYLLEKTKKNVVPFKNNNASMNQLIRRIFIEEDNDNCLKAVYSFDINDEAINTFQFFGYHMITKSDSDERNIMLQGVLFKIKNMNCGKLINIHDGRKIPYFNTIYALLDAPSSYSPVTEAFGIDFGTSTSVLAVHMHFVAGYDLKIVRDVFEEGTLLYSWVAFDLDKTKPICGKTAYDRFVTKAEYIVFDCKKIIGKRLEEIQINDEWKFKVVNDGENVKIQVKSKDQGKEIDILVTPEEVYTIMLERFQENALKLINTTIKKAVFTVPPYFNQKQKDAMKEAAKLANIEVLRFIPEPTAAALSYFSRITEKPANHDLIFVFDLGGGTFDISILKVENSKLIELCQHSNLNLGGTDFNRVLYEYVVWKLKDKHNLEIGKKKHDLWIKCTDAKEDLTNSYDTNICVIDDIDIDITRDEFEEMCEPLIDKIKTSINLSLNKANIKADDITYVIKVGGSCVMPMIKSLIHDTFLNSKREDCDPQHEVAKGAALYASSILSQQQLF